ncbi:hypothetical protein JW905_16790, partial [bacterium]|nr:hypothetical protein [candidate division CSSED10-310 bacterium]
IIIESRGARFRWVSPPPSFVCVTRMSTTGSTGGLFQRTGKPHLRWSLFLRHHDYLWSGAIHASD